MRLARVMFLLAAATALAADSPPAKTSVVPERRATAMVRIARPARIQLGEGAQGGNQDAVLRQTSIRERDGTQKQALLVEFS